MRKIIGAAILGCLIAGPAAAADLAGQWAIKANIANMDVPLDCSIQQDGDKITGHCKGPGAPQDGVLINGTTKGDKADWSYSLDYQGMNITLNYHADMTSPTTMKGTIDMMGQSGSFTGEKK